MSNLYRYMSVGLALIIPLSVLFLFANIVYRKIRGRSIHSAGSIFIGEHLFKLWEPKGKRDAVQEIQYQRDQKREDEDSGEPPAKLA